MSSPLDAVRRLSAASLALLLSRAEFASVELAQARAQLVRWLVLALAGALLALLAAVAVSAWLVLTLWERAGALTLVALAVSFAAAAWWVLARLQREVRQAPPLLAQTLQELAKDRDALAGSRAAGDEPRT
ncbi:MAG: phage holin family protein [Pseudomonadota bacterium]